MLLTLQQALNGPLHLLQNHQAAHCRLMLLLAFARLLLGHTPTLANSLQLLLHPLPLLLQQLLPEVLPCQLLLQQQLQHGSLRAQLP